MTTPRIRSLVSLAAALTVTISLGGCASSNTRLAEADAMQVVPLTFRFDNMSREYVQVFLVGVRREWALSRVAPGSRATMRIPEAALAEDLGTMRLAVLEGERTVLRATGEARAEFTIALPAASIATQQWSYSSQLSRGQQITPMPIGRR